MSNAHQLKGHNNPPEETIVDVVLAARQTKDEIDKIKNEIEALQLHWLQKAQEVTEQERADLGIARDQLASALAKITRWQEKQRRDQPFADPREVSRVIIDGEVAATVRMTESFEIIKADMVPREYCSPDEGKIKAALALGKTVPGINPIKKFSTIVR